MNQDEIQTLVNESIDVMPYPAMHATAYTKDEVIALLNKDRNNIKWAISGRIRNTFLSKK